MSYEQEPTPAERKRIQDEQDARRRANSSAVPIREQALERELERLRKLYGAKFNAVAAALGFATEASDRFVNGDEDEGIQALDKVVSILADA